MKLSLALLCGISAIVWSAAPMASAEAWEPTLPEKITLLHETKLYASPHEDSPSWASLSPQDVPTVAAEADWYKPFPDRPKWVKIRTSWLGDQWVQVDWPEIGWMVPKDEYLDVTGVIPLYNKPEYGYTGTTLSSQIVHTKGIFYRPLQNPSWLLETWMGDKWFTPTEALVIEHVTKLSPPVKVNVQGKASLFKAPVHQPYMGDAEAIDPQSLEATAQQGDFYKVTTQDGKTGWISNRYEQPSGTETVNQNIELKNRTLTYAYPNLQSRLEPLAPQTVHAHAKMKDVWGNTWYLIETWQGDAWMMDEGTERNPDKIAGDNLGFIDVLPTMVSSDKSVSGRIYVASLPKYEGYGGFSFTLQMLDSKGNAIASAEASVTGVQPNDDVPFTAKLDRFDDTMVNYTFRLTNVNFIKAY
ncbi:SH3 domain-containing protein [Bacillus sp. 3255]|uniref:SH3 domain-containing protein n=1 Tax=Bacillus sp. 3255 TaxID=2817904 RepID=UPI00285C2853|nr:SH3 domain-containing protein [Bacillus sp. 3255]MDR6884982.1 hypothetical protein [Bacillus sp. 3255]